MQWVEFLMAYGVASNVRRHGRMPMKDFDTIDVALHRDRLKRTLSRHAVADVVEADALVFVDLAVLTSAGVERMPRQRSRQSFLFLEADANRFCLTAADAVEFGHAASSQIRVEFLYILHLWNRR